MRTLTRAAMLLTLAIVTTFPLAANAATTRTPKIGDCWNYSWNQSEAWSSPTPRVSCSKPHTAVTYYVGTIKGAAARQKDPTADAVGTQAMSRCMVLRRDKLGSNVPLTLAMEEPNTFVPTPAEWKAGKRFFRCDAVIYTSLPSAYHRIPADFLSQIRSSKGATTYAWCRTSGGADVRCSSPHSSRAVTFHSLGGASRKYPGATVVRSEMVTACDASVQKRLGVAWDGPEVYPTSARWKDGDRIGTCFQNE